MQHGIAEMVKRLQSEAVRSIKKIPYNGTSIPLTKTEKNEPTMDRIMQKIKHANKNKKTDKQRIVRRHLFVGEDQPVKPRQTIQSRLQHFQLPIKQYLRLQLQ